MSELDHPAIPIATETMRHQLEQKLADAMAAHVHAPGDPAPLREICDALIALYLDDELLPWVEKALALSPGDLQLVFRRARTLNLVGRHFEAVATWRHYAALDWLPAFYQLHLGQSLVLTGDFEGGIPLLRRAQRSGFAPGDRSACMAEHLLGEALLRTGNPEGFVSWLARNDYDTGSYRPDEVAGWTGQRNLDGKRIFVTHQMGFGDQILLCACVRDWIAAGASVMLTCDPQIHSLMETSLPGCVVVSAARPLDIRVPLPAALQTAMEVFAPDYHLTLLHLPALRAGSASGSDPYFTPYLRVPPSRQYAATRWAEKLRTRHPGKALVGVYWYCANQLFHDLGSKARVWAKLRSLPLDAVNALTTDPLMAAGVHFVNLHHPAASSLTGEPANVSRYLPGIEDFADTAACIEQLDAVIAVDSGVANLAAMMGKPVGVLVPVSSDWRWGSAGLSTPWMQSVTVLRQSVPGDWGSVIARSVNWLAEGAWLAEIVRERAGAPSTEPVFQSAFEAHLAHRNEEAEAGYWRVLASEPGHADALHLLGLIYVQRGKLGEARTLIQKAIGIYENAVFLSNLGDVLTRLGQLAEAEAACHRALGLAPDYALAYYNLSVLYMQTGRLGEAEAALRQVLAIDPGSNDALNNLGMLLGDTARIAEAEAAWRSVIERDPGYLRAHYNLGLQLLRTARFGEAEQAFRRTLEIDPGYADARNNLGTSLREQERFAEAEVTYRDTLSRHSDCVDAGWNLALLLLAQGRYAEGWQQAEARYHPRSKFQTTLPDPGFPQWRGEPLAGRSLVIWHEQGLGDYIQFARYIPLLKARGLRRLTLLCPAPLKPLLETLDGVDEVICDSAAVRPHDFWTLFMSVPLYAREFVDSVPAKLPYLRALPGRIQKWRSKLPTREFKVGLVWKGAPTHQHDADRSLPGFAALARLWSVPGVTFVSLQKGQGEDEPLRLSGELPIVPLGAEIEDLADTAAIIVQLDLVICVDTVVAHLAGALGKPCWVLLNRLWTDWRWMHNRPDSPWYPRVMRLYRQSTPGDWGEVIDRVAESLRQWANDRAAS